MGAIFAATALYQAQVNFQIGKADTKWDSTPIAAVDSWWIDDDGHWLWVFNDGNSRAVVIARAPLSLPFGLLFICTVLSVLNNR